MHINKVKVDRNEKESMSFFKKRRNSPNYISTLSEQKQSIVAIMTAGQIFGLEESFVRNNRDATKRYYLNKVVWSSDKGRVLVFHKKTCFNKLCHNDDTHDILKSMKDYNLKLTTLRALNIK